MNAPVKPAAKPSYDELAAMVAKLLEEKNTPSSPVAFGQSEKNPKFYTFKHGLKDAWPVSTTPEVWRSIFANQEMIKAKLPR